jgi:glycosyltransferase involved in cell wall biosynthesis
MSTRALDILYVGTLPPHPGGSAISAGQLLEAFAARGNTARVLAPATAAQLAAGEPFGVGQPLISVQRLIVPSSYTTTYAPADPSYQRVESEAISRLLPAMIAARRPDVVFIGRESFARQAAGIAASHCVPCVLRAAGATTAGIVQGTYPPAAAAELLEQCRRTDLVITPSEQLARDLRRLGLERVQAILNAVDLDVFRPAPRDPRLMAELAIDESAIVIGYLGNLHERKRPLDIVRSSVRVLAACPNVVYVLVGEGHLRDEAVRTARELGVDGRFRFVNWQSYERIPGYVNLADLVVMPSFGEGLARVYLETQACARVLVASDIPAAREVVDDGETGLLFPVGDVERLAERCVDAARDASLRARIGQAAHLRVQRHDVGRAVTRYLETLTTVAESGVARERTLP